MGIKISPWQKLGTRMAEKGWLAESKGILNVRVKRLERRLFERKW